MTARESEGIMQSLVHFYQLFDFCVIISGERDGCAVRVSRRKSVGYTFEINEYPVVYYIYVTLNRFFFCFCFLPWRSGVRWFVTWSLSLAVLKMLIKGCVGCYFIIYAVIYTQKNINLCIVCVCADLYVCMYTYVNI